MADGVLMVGWGPAIVGREQKALQVFGEAVQHYTQLQQQGEIDSFEAFLLEPHGGDLGGFLLIRGDQNKLAQVRVSEQFQRLNARAQLVVQNFGVVAGVTGDELQRQFGDFGKFAQELGS